MGRINGNLALSRAIGDSLFKQSYWLPTQEQAVISTSTMTQMALDETDVVLVACDGLFERMSNEEVAMFVHTQLIKQTSGDLNPSIAVSKLLAHSLFRGSKDNMSCILWVPKEPNTREKHSDQETAVGATHVFLPEKFIDCIHSAQFVEAYRRDLLRHHHKHPEFEQACSRAAQIPGHYTGKLFNSPH
jgi:hypothetical protein